MINKKRNITEAMYDVRPVDDSGRVDVGKIYRVQPVVNLGNQKPANKAGVWNNDESQSGTQKPNLDSKLSIPARHNKSIDNVDNSFFRGPKGNRTPETQLSRLGSPQAGPTVKSSYQRQTKKQNPEVEVSDVLRQDKPKLHFGASPAKLLEKYINSKLSIKKELTAVGARVEKGNPDAKPRYRQIFVRQKSELTTSQVVPICDVPISQDDYQPILSEINKKVGPAMEVALVGEPREIYPLELTTSFTEPINDFVSPQDLRSHEVAALPEIESWIRYATKDTQTNTDLTRTVADRLKNLKFERIKLLRLNLNMRFNLNSKKLMTVAVVGFSALIFTSFNQYGINLKKEVLKESNSAVANLEEAKESLRTFDFETASSNFIEAYAEFSKMGDSLNFMGASITSLFAELPGAGKLKSAKNLVEAGKLLAEAGKSMSEAVNSLAQTSAILKLSILPTSNVGNMDNFDNLKKSLLSSGKNLSKAKALLSDINSDILPEDKRDAFSKFKSKLPEMEKLVSDGIGYTNFLESFLGVGLTTSDGGATSDVTKKYLVLFQNSSELRPTGGFPGTYAVATFKDGRLDGFLVDDVYNLDGQLKENIIPPKPLQHITPNWGMRDANWFIDFSVSAQKTMEFFKKEAGYEVDGVITISPGMISDMLKVVGPIEMPEYNTVIDAENFVSAVQAEVEYGDNRQQPKQIIVDMAPLLLEKIYSADAGQWMEIFNVFVAGLDKKDVLMYFKDLNLESFVAEKKFGGLVNNTAGDYLMITLTNVKGSKTDRVTDNAIKLEINDIGCPRDIRCPSMIHKLTITRQHNGGSTKYGFYNRQNPAYVRVLVPEGSKLVSISGNSNPGYKPLINYSDVDPASRGSLSESSGFEQDDNLFKLESGFNFDNENGVSTYGESGKTGFAFWLITDPGKQKTVELEYIVPVPASPAGGPSHNIYIQKQPGLEVDNFEFQVGNSYIYNGEFDKDMEFTLKVDN